MADEKKINWTELIVDKLIIAVIVAAASLYIEYYNQENIEQLRASNEQEIEKLRASNAKELVKIDSSTQLVLQQEEFDYKILADCLKFDRKLKLSQDQLEKDIEKIKTNFSNRLQEIGELVEADLNREKNTTNLDYISRQLSEFYWPIYYRLERNNSLYAIMGNSLIGDQIESVILPNPPSLAPASAGVFISL